MRKIQVALAISVLFHLVACQLSFAAIETIYAGYDIFGEIQGGSYPDYLIGSGMNSESYSSIGMLEDYDAGVWEDFWGWRVISETEVLSEQGLVSSTSHTPSHVGALMQIGNMTFDLSEPAEALAWTNTQSMYSPVTNETVEFSIGSYLSFNLPAGLDGNVDLYFGIWQDEMTAGNFLLDEKDGWMLSQLDYNGEEYTLLKHTFTSVSSEQSTNWLLDLMAGNEYRIFTYMEAETVPEPAMLLLLGGGIVIIRRKK